MSRRLHQFPILDGTSIATSTRECHDDYDNSPGTFERTSTGTSTVKCRDDFSDDRTLLIFLSLHFIGTFFMQNVTTPTTYQPPWHFHGTRLGTSPRKGHLSVLTHGKKKRLPMRDPWDAIGRPIDCPRASCTGYCHNDSDHELSWNIGRDNCRYILYSRMSRRFRSRPLLVHLAGQMSVHIVQ